MKPFNKDAVMNETLNDILGLKVKYLNMFSGRIKTGVIKEVKRDAAYIADSRGVSAGVKWQDVYDIR